MAKGLGREEEDGGPTETKTVDIVEEAEEEAVGIPEEAKGTFQATLCRPVSEIPLDSTPLLIAGTVERTGIPGMIVKLRRERSPPRPR